MIRQFNKLPTVCEPQVLVENKVSFDGPHSQLSIYDTYQDVERIKLKSDQPLFCAMLSGRKIMHYEKSNYHSDFLPHESFVMAPNQGVEIDFPEASLQHPTSCLAIEISNERIKATAENLNLESPLAVEYGPWQYHENLLHCHHNEQTQQLLKRMTQIYTENHQDRNYMIDLAVSELTVRLLRQQGREVILSFCAEQKDHSGLTSVVNFINEHLHEPLDNDTLCRIACMCRTKFFQEFKQHLGCSPLAFQQQQRLKKAAKMIAQGLQITRVCFELGFANSSHFSRTFKRFYGVTPRLYQAKILSMGAGTPKP